MENIPTIDLFVKVGMESFLGMDEGEVDGIFVRPE